VPSRGNENLGYPQIQHWLTNKAFDAEANKRISQYVDWLYSQSINNNLRWQEDAARLGALGNPEGCN
jgi:hypothetical protein